ncbi:unnamed protein product [Caenorhabditis brenneri]
MNEIFKYGSIVAIPLYDCSAHSSEKWSGLGGTQRPVLGMVEGIFGILIEIAYIPILLVMLEKDQFKMSCFKIMSLLAIVDILSIVLSCIVTGWLAYKGAVYCTYPDFTYIAGCSAKSLWCCSCFIAMTLIAIPLVIILIPSLVLAVMGISGYQNQGANNLVFLVTSVIQDSSDNTTSKVKNATVQNSTCSNVSLISYGMESSTLKIHSQNNNDNLAMHILLGVGASVFFIVFILGLVYLCRADREIETEGAKDEKELIEH